MIVVSSPVVWDLEFDWTLPWQYLNPKYNPTQRAMRCWDWLLSVPICLLSKMYPDCDLIDPCLVSLDFSQPGHTSLKMKLQHLCHGNPVNSNTEELQRRSSDWWLISLDFSQPGNLHTFKDETSISLPWLPDYYNYTQRTIRSSDWLLISLNFSLHLVT